MPGAAHSCCGVGDSGVAPREPPKKSRKRWMVKKKPRARERESHKAAGAAQRGEGVPEYNPTSTPDQISVQLALTLVI